MSTLRISKAAQELKKATGRGSHVSMAEVAEHFFQQVGGPKQFAKMLYDELNACKPGGLIRARILDIVIQALKFVNIQQPPLDDFSTLSDEDLEMELMQAARKVMNDGAPEDPTDSAPGGDPGPAAADGDGPPGATAPSKPANPWAEGEDAGGSEDWPEDIG